MNEKKRKLLMAVPVGLILLSLAGCAKKEPVAEAVDEPVVQFEDEGPDASVEVNMHDNTEEANTPDETEEANMPDDTEEANIPDDTDDQDDGSKVDAFADYEPDIEADVKAAINSASSLQDEIDKVQSVVAKYSLMASKGETQAELNMLSGLPYMVWDKELNSLWSRISDSADEQTKERLLADQRNWNSMKEEVKLESIGRPEDGGSMYPMNQNAFFEDITFNRCCILANELAKIKGDTYKMPPRSMYATYVDDQGTGSVYSTLITRTGMELDNEAVISIFRLGETEGTFKDKGDGVFEYISYSENVKGIIKMNGWDGATFEVTECYDCPFNAGDKYEFDFAF